MLRKLLAVASLAAFALGCSTLKVNTDYSPGTDFSKYKTFSLQAGTPLKNQLAQERLDRAITKALQAKGLRAVPSGADLEVYTHARLSKEQQFNTTSFGYGGWGGYRGGWGYGGMGGTATTTVTEIPVGTLIVDIVDNAADQAVWRGTATDQLSPSKTPEEAEQKADAVMAKLFENFPPGSAAK